MDTNNFDMSSTGTNIEFAIYRDDDLAQIYFEDSFTRMTDWTLVFDKEGTPEGGKYRALEVRGYSQGEVREVLVYEERNQDRLYEHLQNLLFNQPLHGHLIINGEDYGLGLEGEYSFEPEKILEHVRKIDLPAAKAEYVYNFVKEKLESRELQYGI